MADTEADQKEEANWWWNEDTNWWWKRTKDVPSLCIDTRKNARDTIILAAWDGWPSLKSVPANSTTAELFFEVTYSYCANPPIDHVRIMVSKENWNKLGEDFFARAGILGGHYSLRGPNYRTRQMTFTHVVSPNYLPNGQRLFDYDLVLGPLRCVSATTTLTDTNWTKTFEFNMMRCSLAEYNGFFVV